MCIVGLPGLSPRLGRHTGTSPDIWSSVVATAQQQHCKDDDGRHGRRTPSVSEQIASLLLLKRNL